MNIMILN